MSLKKVFVCNICELVLKDPVTLPCLTLICGEHLRDGTAKNGSIRCNACEKVFRVCDKNITTDEIVNNILAKDVHLSDEEKAIKHAIQFQAHQLEQLQSDVKRKQIDMEVVSFDHFTEIRRNIDIQREELKAKIDEISLSLIDQANEKETAYKLRITQTIACIVDPDLQQSSQIVAHEFRNPNMPIAHAKQLQSEHEQKLAGFQARIYEFESLGMHMKSLQFKANTQGFHADSFGCLDKSPTIACSFDNVIKIWNLELNTCMNTLGEHSRDVSCLENISENRFASGSCDKTIKIWDAKSYVCLRTLTGHSHTVRSLKSLASNRLASGAWGQVKIWDYENGQCIHTLNAHLEWVFDLVCLTNGKLASCSQDKTIKVWNLDTGTCSEKLEWHSSCLLLLKNGHLAVGSLEKVIQIWSNNRPYKILKGHTSPVDRLKELDTGELISFSTDFAIKIWDLKAGRCIATLIGHTNFVSEAQMNRQRSDAVSCSSDGTIKTWDLKTGKCINSVTAQNGVQIKKLIFI